MRLDACRFIPRISRTGFQNCYQTIQLCWGRFKHQFYFIVPLWVLKALPYNRPPKVFNPTRYSILIWKSNILTKKFSYFWRNAISKVVSLPSCGALGLGTVIDVYVKSEVGDYFHDSKRMFVQRGDAKTCNLLSDVNNRYLPTCDLHYFT